MKKCIQKETKATQINRFGISTKVVAILLLFLLCAGFLLCAAASITAIDCDYHRGSSPDAQINLELWNYLVNITDRDLRELAILTVQESIDAFHSEYTSYGIQHIKDCYTSDVSNVLYRITDGNGKVLESNYTTLPPTLTHYRIEDVYTYHYMTYDQPEDATTMISDEDLSESTATQIPFTIDAYIRADLPAHDCAYYIKEIHLLIYDIRYLTLALTFITFFLCCADLFFLCAIAGKRKGESGARESFLDRIPLEIVTVAYVILIIALAVFIADVLYYTPFFYDYLFCFILIIGVYVALFASTLYVLLTLAVRIKTKTLFKSTLIYQIFAFIARIFRKAGSLIGEFAGNKASFVRYTLITLFSILADMLSIALIGYGEDLALPIGILLWCIKTVLIAVLLFRNALSLLRLSEGSRKIVAGDLEHVISYAGLESDYKELAANFNHIRNGLTSALDKQMKSERMKTELITNVSHDIKTPLTCIINYVDLLKNEPMESEKAKEYVAVLDKQSARLKKLTEDLIETSKAASGSIPVNAEPTDIAILLSQAIGEYRDRFEKAQLETVTELQEQNMTAFCDGRLCWRIFDNLLGNIAKYSLPGTRVYVTADTNDGFVSATFKNISKEKLNISPEELTERFVRGDSSRNTEGSGLGLSIAQSLAELQRGRLDIVIDGDMFKVTVTLPCQ
ncbi:MAG: hypothetical protein IJY39_02570 [Clostridia bacterium]|nr:hypothetical protein [Clostridia bacterium]